MNKSKSFCAINSLNNNSNKNPNDLSFTTIFSSDKKDNNTSLDGNISIIKNGYGVESPKSIYEPVLKNLKLDDDFELDSGFEKANKSVGVIGESTKTIEKISHNNESLEIDYIKINDHISSKESSGSSSSSDSSVNENDFIEFTASKRPETIEENLKSDNNNKLDAKDINNSTIKNSSISSSTSPTIIYSPIYHNKNELSIDEVIFGSNNINNHNNSKISSSSSSSTQINTNSNDSFINGTKTLSPIGHDDISINKKLQNEIEEGKSNNDLIKQLYSKIEQLQKENNELSQTCDYHMMMISKLEDQLKESRSENNNLKKQLNKLS